MREEAAREPVSKEVRLVLHHFGLVNRRKRLTPYLLADGGELSISRGVGLPIVLHIAKWRLLGHGVNL